MIYLGLKLPILFEFCTMLELEAQMQTGEYVLQKARDGPPPLIRILQPTRFQSQGAGASK